MSKKVIDAVWKQKHIEVYTKMLELPDMDRYPSYDELHVLIDGVEPDSFGETFPGYKITADDMFMKLISAYVSNETYITFNEVDEQIIKLKTLIVLDWQLKQEEVSLMQYTTACLQSLIV